MSGTISSRPVGSMTVFCRAGDVTLSWEAKNEAAILAGLQKLLDKKMTFFIVRKKKPYPVTKLSQVKDSRQVVLPDATLHEMFASGVMAVGGLVFGEQTGEIARTPEQVYENDTLAVPAAGWWLTHESVVG